MVTKSFSGVCSCVVCVSKFRGSMGEGMSSGTTRWKGGLVVVSYRGHDLKSCKSNAFCFTAVFICWYYALLRSFIADTINNS